MNTLHELVKKPPVGLRPNWIWLELRLKEIEEAIQRYHEDDRLVPVKWYEEYFEVKKMWDERKR